MEAEEKGKEMEASSASSRGGPLPQVGIGDVGSSGGAAAGGREYPAGDAKRG